MTTTLSTAVDYGLEAQDVPKTAADALRFSFDPDNKGKPTYRIIGLMTTSMINHKRELTLKERQMAFNILQSFASMQKITQSNDKMLGITMILNHILGESPHAKGPYEFPEPFPKDAAIILDRIEGLIAAEPAAVAVPALQDLDLNSPSSPRAAKKRRTSAVPARLNLADPTLRDIMHDIIITEGLRRSYKIADDATRRDCDVIGHNGLTVGQWWPYRVCAIRDGAHGAMMAGIAGGEKTGTFSIVVSGNTKIRPLLHLQY